VDLNRLRDILAVTTVALRKGEVVDGNSIYAMPSVADAPKHLEKVDCVFIVIGVAKAKAEELKPDLIEILKTYPKPDRLAGGPSYIEVGAVLGDQGAAFQLFALGKVLGLWEIMTPATIGVTDENEAMDLAVKGFVMISGWKSG
jgi:hypothetical protein